MNESSLRPDDGRRLSADANMASIKSLQIRKPLVAARKKRFRLTMIFIVTNHPAPIEGHTVELQNVSRAGRKTAADA